MTDAPPSLLPLPPVMPGRPLIGQTILLVEDSRFASEAVRLLCQRFGARMRRADCLASARRHLASYRPTAVIVDLGLPDGPGEALIEELAAATPRLPLILGTSGDPSGRVRALAAGADGFIEKPMSDVGAFLEAILARPVSDSAVSEAGVHPDPLAYRDDIAGAAAALAEKRDASRILYIARFLGGLAQTARDSQLQAAAADLAVHRDPQAVVSLIEHRLSRSAQL